VLTRQPEGESGLSGPERLRYARHLVLPEVGVAGQERLRAARVLLVGAGGLGSPLALYLAAAGVGTLGIADADRVERSNLQRQPLHGESDIGASKVSSAAARLAEVNPHVKVEAHPVRVTAANARELIGAYQVVADGSDNYPTRYLLNDACAAERRPLVYGAVDRFEGQVSVFWAERGPCYRCLFPEPPPPGAVPGCAEAGVLGVLPGLIGSLQALEVLKLLLGVGAPLIGRLLRVDGLAMSFRELRLPKDPACPVCSRAPREIELIDYDRFCGLETGGESMTADVPEITPGELRDRLERGDPLTIIDVREPYEWEIGNLERYGARLIPMGELPERLAELDPQEEIVLQCRSGGRSARVLKAMRGEGFTRLLNLKGGILAWSDEVDPSIPKY
jgi:sulfur-carrier protein adenylyltransferase/sulfurtransferase